MIPDVWFASEAYRHECEVRHVCNMPSADIRREYLDMVEKKRGKELADTLRNDVRALWLKRGKERRGL